MSKSIYDEALEKIYVEFDSWERAEYLELLELVEQALEQAQKQEKLLELYRYLNENTNDYDLHYETVDEIDNKIEELEKQIKELENE